jgi:hypothetical protein
MPKRSPEIEQQMSEREVSPHDCALLLGIPVTRQTFQSKLQVPSSHAALFVESAGWNAEKLDLAWSIYERRVAQPILTAVEAVKELGVCVQSSLSEKTLSDVMKTKHVVTVFTHFDEHGMQVETHDRMLSAEALSASLPAEFSGVLELCLCKSMFIAGMFKDRLPASTILSNRDIAQPATRALLYQKVIELLAEFPGYYTDATADIRKRVAKLWTH